MSAVPGGAPPKALHLQLPHPPCNGPGPPPREPTETTLHTVTSAFTAAALTAGVRLVAFDFDLCVLSIHSYALRLTPAAVLARTTPLAQDFTDLPLFQALVESLLAHGVPVAIASFGRNEVIRTFLGRAFPAVVWGGAGGLGSGGAAGGGVTSAAGDGPPDTAGGGAAPSASATINKPALSTCSTVGVSPGLGGGGSDGQHPLFTICTPQTVGLLDGCSDSVNGKNVQLAYLAQHMGDLDKDNVVFFDDDGKNIRLALEGGWKYATHTPKGLNTEAIMAATAALMNSAAI